MGNGLKELLPSPSSRGLSELGAGVAIGLGFGFEGKTLDKATRKAASLLPDARCGCRVGQVVVRLAQTSFLLSGPPAEDEFSATAQETHCEKEGKLRQMPGHTAGVKVEKRPRMLVQRMKNGNSLLPKACLSQERQWKHTELHPS